MGNLVQAFYTWYRNTLRNAKYRWLVVAGTLIYLLSPIDIAPDFIPVIGWIDDGILVTLLVSEVSLLMTEFLQGRSRPVADQEPVIVTDQVIDVPAQ